MDNKVTTAVNGIKSKARVQKHGEVFTPDSIVCDMHDGVTRNLLNSYREDYKKQPDSSKSLDDYIRDTYIEETYLEPTCGDGQFLIRILDEKIKYVNKVPVEQRELALVKAVSTIYGIDIQADNVAEARARLENYLFNSEVDTFDVGGKGECRPFNFIEGIDITDDLKRTLSNIIHNNIIVGNMLQVQDITLRALKDLVLVPRIIEYVYNEETKKFTVEYCKITDLQRDTDNESLNTDEIRGSLIGIYGVYEIPAVNFNDNTDFKVNVYNTSGDAIKTYEEAIKKDIEALRKRLEEEEKERKEAEEEAKDKTRRQKIDKENRDKTNAEALKPENIIEYDF